MGLAQGHADRPNMGNSALRDSIATDCVTIIGLRSSGI